MTLKELWHIKIGTRVVKKHYNGSVSHGTIVRRKVDDETSGFMIAHNRKTNKVETKDFKTGRKYLTVTVKFDDGDVRYYDTLPPFYRLDDLDIFPLKKKSSYRKT